MPKNKVKKKTSPSASFRQYYLDTIKEVYKPRHNKNEKDLIFYEKSKGYLQESLGDKLKLTKLGKSQAVYKKEKNVINSDLESELEDSSKEKKNSLTERAKNSQTTIKMNKEEKISKYFLLPKIPKKKKQVSEKNKTLKIPRTKSFFDKKIIIPTIITRDKSENLHEKSNTNVPLNEDSSYLFQKSTPYSVNPNYGFSNLKSSFDNKMESSVKHKTDISIKQKNNDIKSSTLILHPPFINDNSLSSSTIPKNIIPQKENISNTKVLSDPDNGSISQNFNDPPDNYINKNNDYYNNNNLSPRVLLHKIIPLQDIHANSKSNGFNENSDNINKFSEINNQNYENNFKNPIENNPKFSSSNNVNEKNSDNQDLNNNSNEENSKNSDENKINGQKLINSHIQNEKNLNRFIPNLEEIDNMNLKNDDKLNEINIVRNLENLNLEKTVFITLDKKNEKQMDNETLPDLLEENERKQRISILDNIKEKNFSNQDISNMSKVNLPILDQNISNLDKLDLKILDNIKEKKIPNKNLGVDEAIDINVSNQNSPNLSNLHDDKEKIDNSYNLTFNEQLQSPPELSSPEFIKKPISQNKNNKQNTNISNEINSYFKEEIGQNSKIKKERKASPCIKIKQLSDNSLLKKSEHTSFKLTPQKITSLRRGTNTAGIDNSFSLMKKIFDEQEFKNEQYSIKYEKVLHFKNHSSQKSCDSLTNQSTSTNSLLSQIHLNFNKKNTNYERKTQFKIEKNPQSLTKQSSRNSIFRQSQNFKKKAKRFFTLLANLHLTFRTGSEETNSFMFLDSRYQNEDKPLINLREIFRKKTLEETQNNLFGKIQKPKNKQILMRSGTSGAEKNESVASLTSPITQKSFVENSSNGSLFFINVHPPNLDNEIIFEYSELQEEIKKDETEMDKFKRKIRDFRGSLKEEQTKLMNLQIFNHKKLWKLSLGYLISNYKMLLVTEKEYMAGINFNFSPLIEIFPKTRRSEISLLPKKIIIDYKISIENEYILKKFDYNLDDENLIKSFKRDDELEEESYEEIFNQNSDFMEDNKNCDNEYIFKFLYHNNKFEENLEPLNIRRKAKDFFSFLESTFLPILTKLDQSFQNNSSIIFKLDETDLTVLSSGNFLKYILVHKKKLHFFMQFRFEKF